MAAVLVVLVVATGCGSRGPATQADATDVDGATPPSYPLPPVVTGMFPGPDVATSVASPEAAPTDDPLHADDVARFFPSAMPGQVITFQIGEPIPALAGDADLWRLAPGAEADAQQVAAAFGIDAPFERVSDNWRIGTGGAVPAVSGYSSDGSGALTTWSYFSGTVGAPRCPRPGSSAVLPSGYPDCVAGSAAAPVTELVDRAVAVARAVGFDAEPASAVVTENDQVRTVSLFQQLGDLWNPVPLTVSWSYGGAIVAADGAFGAASVVGHVSRIGTEQAVSRLGDAALEKPRAPSSVPGATPDTGPQVPPGTAVVAFPPQPRGPSAVASVAATTALAEPVATASVEPVVTTPPAGAVVVPARISAARPALLSDPLAAGALLLVPAYVFTTQYGEVIASAVDPSSLDPYRASR